MDIVHLEAYQYAHISDKIENIVFLIQGPLTYVLKSFEEVVLGQSDMIKLSPNTFIRIKNPVVRKEGDVVSENIHGKPSKLMKLKFGDEEVRTFENFPEPFPLYPGEEKIKDITKARIISDTQSLRLRTERTFTDPWFNIEREIGSEWILPGPLVYYDRVEVDVIEALSASTITYNRALRVKAKKDFTDINGIARISGEEWLIKTPGSYIQAAEEDLVKYEYPIILNDQTAITLEATGNFKDAYGIQRDIGSKWIVTNEISSIHLCDVYEKHLKTSNKIILNKWQYCRIRNPSKNGVNQYGSTEIRKGETSFFLQPNEELVNNKIEDIHILSKDEALLIMCKETFKDENGIEHISGERWIVQGPRSFIPSIEIEIIDKRERIYLSENDGIYVRDIHSGEVKLVSNTSYLLEAHEELWEKELPEDVSLLLENDGHYDTTKPPKLKGKRVKSDLVSFIVPHNSVTQIFDYKKKKNNVVFGPQTIKLNPHEQFTILKLSGGNPKYENRIKSLIKRLGPDYLSDTIEVETSDHAKLNLKLTYSWQFIFDKNSEEDLEKLFQVHDFVGDACKSIASRIRGIVSSVSFDTFHKESSVIVQVGVFGKNSEGKLKKPLFFKANNLYITNVDIQSQEPVDSKTRVILNDSMKMSMTTNIKIQEAVALHSENRANQEAKGKVEIKEIEDQTELEDKRLILLELEAQLNKGKLI